MDCTLILAGMSLAYIPLWILAKFLPTMISALIPAFLVTGAGLVFLLKDIPVDLGGITDFRSPGKRAMNVRVVTNPGRGQIGLFASIHRNAIFIGPILCTLLSQVVFYLPFDPFGTLMYVIKMGLALTGVVSGLGAIGYEVYNLIKDPAGRRWGDIKADTMVISD